MARLAFALGLVTTATLLTAATGCGTATASDGDGSDAATVDANAQVVQASDYDQSCATDTDCVSVTEGNICHPSVSQCPNTAISQSAFAQYQADVDQALTYCDDPSACGFVSPRAASAASVRRAARAPARSSRMPPRIRAQTGAPAMRAWSRSP